IMTLMMISIIKAAKYDLHYQPDYSLNTIHIEELPENSPWEHGDTSEAPQGSVLAQQAEYEEIRLNLEEEEAATRLDT
ncbi:MAG: choline transporter, partial [Oceanisphaera sp.]|nr:choline transporter [Oceanisphaera sp.]